MPGLARRVEQLIPGKACQGCYLTQHPDIDFYVETGLFTEVEGSLYLCNRCFHEMVRVTNFYVTVADSEDTTNALKLEIQRDLSRLHDLEVAAKVLKDEFNLNLDDLTKYTKIKAKVIETDQRYETVSRELSEKVLKTNHLNGLLTDLADSVQNIEAQIHSRNLELDELISSSLTQILVKRGREDLIDIILNNRIPDDDQPGVVGGEPEVDGSFGESLSPVPSF